MKKNRTIIHIAIPLILMAYFLQTQTVSVQASFMIHEFNLIYRTI